MKIAVMGYSGSGKSTLSRKLGELYQVPVLHLDSVQFLPNWKTRSTEEQGKIVQTFLNDNPSGWVIDGNYNKLSYERRIIEADIIIQLLFSRKDCLLRCINRYRTYKGKTRPDMAVGCDEKLDFDFIKWILWDGRSKNIQDRYVRVQNEYPSKVVILCNQQQLNGYLQNLKDE